MSSLLQPRDKVLSQSALLQKLRCPRDRSIVFTNGVFDILHRGHVAYLYAAREMGDLLIVGLNTDASVRRLKGPERPINSEDDRAFVLAGLGCVDYVTFFADDTPRELVASLLPDVLVKGGDYTPDTIVGRAEVEAAGGRVVVIPLVTGRSTSQTVQRIRGMQ